MERERGFAGALKFETAGICGALNCLTGQIGLIAETNACVSSMLTNFSWYCLSNCRKYQLWDDMLSETSYLSLRNGVFNCHDVVFHHCPQSNTRGCIREGREV